MPDRRWRCVRLSPRKGVDGWEEGARPMFFQPDAEMFAQHVETNASIVATGAPVAYPDAIRIVWAAHTVSTIDAVRRAWIVAAKTMLSNGVSPEAIVAAIYAAGAVEEQRWTQSER